MNRRYTYMFLIGYAGLTALFWWPVGLSYFWYVLGLLVGWNFSFIDRLVHAYVRYPHEHFSQHIQHLFAQGRFVDMWRLFQKRGEEQKRLWSRSMLFLPIWFVLTFFVLSSTVSLFSLGLLLGMGLYFVNEFLACVRQPQKLVPWYWMLKHPPQARTSERIVYGYFFIFGVISLWAWW